MLNERHTNALRDGLIEKMRRAGIDINTDWQEGERILTQENERVREMSRSQKRAMETASVSHDEEHQHAVISFADGAKVRNNSETTKDKEKKKNCLLLHHSALIAGASARQLKQSWHRVPSIRKINQLSCQAGSKWRYMLRRGETLLMQFNPIMTMTA